MQGFKSVGSAQRSLNPRSHLQHLQCPTPSDISKNAPSLPGLSHAGVARSRRRRMISAVEPDEPASNFQQRDNALKAVFESSDVERFAWVLMEV